MNVNKESLRLFTQGIEKAVTGANVISAFETARKVINRDYNPVFHALLPNPYQYPSGKQLYELVEQLRVALYKVEAAQKRGVDFTMKEIVGFNEVNSILTTCF